MLGDPTFAPRRVNPPLKSADDVIGASVGLGLVGYLRAQVMASTASVMLARSNDA